jgi:uncharacterized protein (DUF1800 family)
MDRKEFFLRLKKQPGLHIPERDRNAGYAAAVPSLNVYTGAWTYETSSHLLRRTTFGPTHALINQSVSLGLVGTLIQLFKPSHLPAPPLRYIKNAVDPNCPLGQVWTNKPMFGDPQAQHREDSLRAWNFMQLYNEGMSIREKLTLFWMNHFGCGNNRDVRADYVYVQLLRAGASGSFRQLVKNVTVTPAMLHFLNSDVNEKDAPNENFARELLELFTIGKGPLIAPGDYTHYTEEDIKMLAKCFSGWRIKGFWGANNLTYTAGYFDPQYHDISTKKLSAKFGSISIPNSGDKEYANVIDIIFQQKEVSHFICRKLYRWFCYYNIDPVIETNIITPMATALRNSNYNIMTTIWILLRSQHFYDVASVVGPIGKSPIDYMLSVLKQSHVAMPANWQDQYSISFVMNGWLEAWQMDYFGVPGVAGWKAYYQSPLYNRMWTNATSLQQHQVFVNQVLDFGYQVPGEGTGQTVTLKVKPLSLLNIIANPADPNAVIAGLSKLFFPVALPQSQKDALKYILLPGLPDFEWTIEYNDYKADPANPAKISAVEARLKNVLAAIYMMAENHLS